MKQMPLFDDVPVKAPRMAVKALRMARPNLHKVNELEGHADLLARAGAPANLIKSMLILAELRQQTTEWELIRAANGTIWHDYLAWLDQQVNAMPEGPLKNGARAAWQAAARRVRFTEPEYWFFQVLWRLD